MQVNEMQVGEMHVEAKKWVLLASSNKIVFGAKWPYDFFSANIRCSNGFRAQAVKRLLNSDPNSVSRLRD